MSIGSGIYKSDGLEWDGITENICVVPLADVIESNEEGALNESDVIWALVLPRISIEIRRSVYELHY